MMSVNSSVMRMASGVVVSLFDRAHLTGMVLIDTMLLGIFGCIKFFKARK